MVLVPAENGGGDIAAYFPTQRDEVQTLFKLNEANAGLHSSVYVVDVARDVRGIDGLASLMYVCVSAG